MKYLRAIFFAAAVLILGAITVAQNGGEPAPPRARAPFLGTQYILTVPDDWVRVADTADFASAASIAPSGQCDAVFRPQGHTEAIGYPIQFQTHSEYEPSQDVAPSRNAPLGVVGGLAGELLMALLMAILTGIAVAIAWVLNKAATRILPASTIACCKEHQTLLCVIVLLFVAVIAIVAACVW